MDDLGLVEAVDGFGESIDAPMSVKSWLRPHQLGLAWGRDTQRGSVASFGVGGFPV
jgi:hypothetical protein